jgi:hypothetical protein
MTFLGGIAGKLAPTDFARQSALLSEGVDPAVQRLLARQVCGRPERPAAVGHAVPLAEVLDLERRSLPLE